MKKIVWIIALLGITAAAGATVFGISRANAGKTSFAESGYVLMGDDASAEKQVPVGSEGTYSLSKADTARFSASEGGTRSVPAESFVRLGDDTFMAFSRGVLLDFNDLSGNFINNYSIPAGMKITRAGSSYTADTTNGSMNFGEHIWKLSDSRYLVRAPELTVVFGEGDERPAGEYVQVTVSEDGIVYLLTAENLWSTMSEDCSIRTGSGVMVNPVSQRVEMDSYRLSMAGLSVEADDLIVLTEDETRRQIVPELKITAVDGTSGDDGTDGKKGTEGTGGTNGTGGKSGENGTAGKNGDNGQAGTAGTAGSSGASGSSGKSGEAGSSGSNGAAGTAGGSGQSGANGQGGAGGSSGTGGGTGESGENGNSGQDGDAGVGGGSGANGDKGEGGTDGKDGDDGGEGSTGGSGSDGRDASETSSVNSAVPTMTLKSWEVSSTGLKGELSITDPSGFLRAVCDDSELHSDTYPASVTVTDIESGETISCEQFDASYSVVYGSNFHKAFNYDPIAPVYFAVNPETDRLSPDTGYRLDVVAYYKAGTTVFSRTFVSRTFYTDSAGVILTAGASTCSSTAIEVHTSSGSGVTYARFYLMTEEQAEELSLSGWNSLSTDEYIYYYDVNYEDGKAMATGYAGLYGYDQEEQTFSSAAQFTLDFVPAPTDPSRLLPSNASYVARAVVKTRDGSSEILALSVQELDLVTLKKEPTWDKDKRPSATYNRLTGEVEVTRPVVSDIDSAAVQYTYKVLKYDTEEKIYKETDTAKKIQPGTPDPVSFTLPTEEQIGGTTVTIRYQFSVEIEAFDNVKTVWYDMGTSEEFSVSGDTLPAIGFEASQGYPVFNEINGTCTITLGSKSRLELSQEKPLYLDITADTLYENTIVLDKPLPTGGETHSVSKSGVRSSYSGSSAADDWSVTVSNTASNTNQYMLNIDLGDLCQNKKYTVTIRGWVSLGDSVEGAETQLRELGFFSFRTPRAANASASWQKVEGSSYKIDYRLSIATDDSDVFTAKGGQAAIALYEGDDVSTGTKLKTIYIDKMTDGGTSWNALFNGSAANGLEINDALIGNEVSLDVTRDYCLYVSYLYDQTYDLMSTTCVNYESPNRVETISNRDLVIKPSATVPVLTEEPENAVTAVAIRNSEAVDWGIAKKEGIDDNAVIGYTLETNFSNKSHLAYQVRYYAFEYSDFYNALESGSDPLQNYLVDGEDKWSEVGIKKLKVMTQTFEADEENTLPKAAILFDCAEDFTDEQAAAEGVRLGKDCSVYHVKSMSGSAGSREGMSRGYRYVFAYTAEYMEQGGTQAKVYPYDVSSGSVTYESRKNSSGIGKVSGESRFLGTAYILNSGMLSAAKCEPKFYTYLKTADPELETDPAVPLERKVSSGTAVLRYTYSDPDKTIGDEFTYETLVLRNEGGSRTVATEQITGSFEKCTGTDDWKSLTLEFASQITSSASGSAVNAADIVPTVECERYAVNYDGILETYYGTGTKDSRVLAFGLASCDYDMSGWLAAYNNDSAHSGAKLPQASLDTEHLSENYFDLKFDTADATRLVAGRTYTATVTVTGKDRTDPSKDLTVEIGPLKVQGSRNDSYVRIELSRLAGLESGTVTVSGTISYDDGAAGWDQLTGQEGYGLYYKKVVNSAGTSVGYVTGTGYTALPFGGLFRKAASAPDLEALEPDEKTASGFVNAADTMIVFDRDLKSSTYGVDVSSNDGLLLVPKQASESNIYFGTSTEAEVEIGVMLPVITYKKYVSQPAAIVLKGGLSVTGLEDVKPCLKSVYSGRTGEGEPYEGLAGITDTFYIVHAALFDTIEDSKDETAYGKKIADGGKVRDYIQVLLTDQGDLYGYCRLKTDAAGNPSPDNEIEENSVVRTTGSDAAGWEGLPSTGELPSGTHTYYMSCFMDFSEGGSTAHHIIIGSDIQLTAVEGDYRAIYKVKTTDDTQIEISSISYNGNNESYFTKQLKAVFGFPDGAYGLTAQYCIYETEEDAEAGQNQLIDLSSVPGSGLIRQSPDPLLDQENELIVNFDPWTLETVNKTLRAEGKTELQNLQLSSTYWLRISVKNQNGTEVGHTVESFGVAASRWGVKVGFSASTSTSAVFYVNVTDPQHVAMGFRYEEGRSLDSDPSKRKYNDEGLYAVRFADENGNQIQTPYDDYVFSFADVRQRFSLGGSGSSVTLTPGTAYYCYVYLIRDTDLNGRSSTIDGGSAESSYQDWKYFFEDLYKTENRKTITVGGISVTGWKSETFKTLVDQFWSGGHRADQPAVTAVRDCYELGSGMIRTAGDGPVISAEDTTLSSSGTQILLTAAGTSNVVISDGGVYKQGFACITYTIREKSTGVTITKVLRSPGDADQMFQLGADGSTVLLPLEFDDSLESGGTYSVTVYAKQYDSVTDPGVEYSFSQNNYVAK